MPAAVSARRPGLLSRGAAVCVVKLLDQGAVAAAQRKHDSFPGDGDSRDVVVLAARLHRRVEVVQALLAAVGDLQDVVGLSFLAVGERRADTRFAAVVPSSLDQRASCEPVFVIDP